METGKTRLSVTCLCLVISGALAVAVGDMEGPTDASQKLVRESHCLCAGEQNYVNQRKQIVMQSLNKLEIMCDADSVPHIALLASGGGQRAAVGLVGALHQMKTEGLLDPLMYLGGVSGSTWSMATLYSDPDWSNNMDKAVSRLLVPGVQLEEALAWLGERAKEEHFSLTDVWGVLTSAALMKQLDLRHLSDEASRNATNPYPIYCAIEKQCFNEGPTVGKWFEVTPHEAGFTELGLFIDTPLLGSKFQNGVLLEKKPEMDMVKLQGVLGCALAHGEVVFSILPDWLNVPGHVDAAATEYLMAFNTLNELLSLMAGNVKDPTALAHLDRLKKSLQDKVNRDQATWKASQTTEQKDSIFQTWLQELVMLVDSWCDTLEEGQFKTHATIFNTQVIPLLLRWEWGTTYNFLYQHQNPTIPPSIRSKERFHLIDAGLLINVAYPSFMGDKRDIDLMIVPEFSAGLLFETLTITRDYAASLGKPFPPIDDKVLEDKDWPKSCYVFEGKDKEPTVIYMPTFNRDNCRDAAEVIAKAEEFSTFQRPFPLEKIVAIVEIAKANIKNNRDTLLREYYKASLRRKSKRMAAMHQPAGPCAVI